MEKLADVCRQNGWRLGLTDMPFWALIFDEDNVILVNPDVTQKAIGNIIKEVFKK